MSDETSLLPGRRWAGRLSRIGVVVVVSLSAVSVATLLVTAGQQAASPRPGAGSAPQHPAAVPALPPGEMEQRSSQRDREMFRFVIDWLETPTTRCRDLRRLGGGGRPVCFDPPLELDPDSCLVYSFTSGSDWSFELELASRGCEVHAFDSTAAPPTGPAAAGVRLYRQRVAEIAKFGGSGPIASLKDIRTRLGHSDRRIHYLRVDDGDAVSRLLVHQLALSDHGFMLDSVQQLGATLEVPAGPRAALQFSYLETALGYAGELGFRLASSEPLGAAKLLYPSVDRPVHAAYDVLLVKTGRDIFDRLDRNRTPL